MKKPPMKNYRDYKLLVFIKMRTLRRIVGHAEFFTLLRWPIDTVKLSNPRFHKCCLRGLTGLKLIIAGCEYAGKTTLLGEVKKWAEGAMGGVFGGHDHFTFPCKECPEEERKKLLALGPSTREMFQRYMMEYHLAPFEDEKDHVLVGFHVEEAVYAPLYYGYGRPGEFGDRQWLARHIDRKLMKHFPGIVLVLVKASPDEIAKRMKENPHPDGVLKEGDIEHVLKRFEEEYRHSLIYPRFVLDTTGRTAEETLKQFVESMVPHLEPIDILRMLNYEKLKKQFT